MNDSAFDYRQMTSMVTNPPDEDDKHAPDWAKIIFSLLVCVFGIIGNAISIFIIVVLKEYKKSVLHMYVLQLAIADMAFLLTLPFKVHEDLQNRWMFPDWMCTAKETILFLNYNASVLFLIVMSIDRYIAVCHSFSVGLKRLREPRAALAVISLVWVVALLSCIPVINNSHSYGSKPHCKCQLKFRDVETAEERCQAVNGDAREICIKMILRREVSTGGKYCVDPKSSFPLIDMPDELLLSFNVSMVDFNLPEGQQSATPSASSRPEGIAYDCNYFETSKRWIRFLYTNFIVLYLLPILVMTITYGLIIRRVKVTRMPSPNVSNSEKMDAFRKMESQNNENGQQKKTQKKPNIRTKVNVMCASLVLTFTVCWLPFHAVHLARIRGIPLTESKKYICISLSNFGTLLGYVNSLLNPMFYSFFGTDFAKRWTNARTTIKKTITPAGGMVNSKRKTNKIDSCNFTKASVLSKPSTKKLLITRSPHERSLANI